MNILIVEMVHWITNEMNEMNENEIKLNEYYIFSGHRR